MIKFRTLTLLALTASLAGCPAPAPNAGPSPSPSVSPTASPTATPAQAEGPDVEGCEHLAEGPATEVTAQSAANAGKVMVGNDHKRYDVALADGMNAVTFESGEAAHYVFFLGQDVPLTLTDASGQAVAIEERKTENLPCGEMKARVTADLGVGPYTLTFGPTEATMVGIVIEEDAQGHDEDDDHQ